MKKKLGIVVTCLASFALAAALWVFAPASSNAAAATTAQTAQTPAAAQSVSGKIASIEKNSFTLTVGSEPKSNVSENTAAQAGQSAKTMNFQIDSNTTLDGKLKVGANADVTYRQEGGNNIAISVRVS